MNPTSATRRALVVEDDVGTRLVVRRLLQGAGYVVTEAATGAEALGACDEWLPDVILLDVGLPDISGYEICQQLRTLYSKQELPILMVTGSVDPKDIAYAFSVGANDFVGKPIEKLVLLARVDNQVAIAHAQKEVEASRAKIARSLEVQRTMGDQLTQAIMIEDDKGNIVYTNRTLTNWCGGKEQHFTTTAFDWLLQGAFRERLVSLWMDVHEEGAQITKHELSLKRRVLEVTCKDIPSRGSGRLWLWVIDDLSERRALEEAASQRVKFDSLGLFSVGVAHNFNNLLSGILGASEVLNRLATENDRAKRCVKIIRTSVDAGRNLTRKLSALQRRSAVDSVMITSPANAIEAVVNCYKEVSDAIEFEVDVPSAIRSVNMSDANLIDVFANLLSNAVDAIGDKQGRISVRVVPVANDETVTFEIRDTGKGMGPETRRRLFEPFYSTKHLDTANGMSCAGNGLGLWTVYNLVKAAGGTVTVESIVGEGTTITLEIPVASAQKEQPISSHV